PISFTRARLTLLCSSYSRNSTRCPERQRTEDESSCVLLTTKDEDREQLQTLAQREKLETLLATTPYQEETRYFAASPGRCDLHKEALVIVIVLQRLSVQASYAFRKGELRDGNVDGDRESGLCIAATGKEVAQQVDRPDGRAGRPQLPRYFCGGSSFFRPPPLGPALKNVTPRGRSRAAVKSANSSSLRIVFIFSSSSARAWSTSLRTFSWWALAAAIACSFFLPESFRSSTTPSTGSGPGGPKPGPKPPRTAPPTPNPLGAPGPGPTTSGPPPNSPGVAASLVANFRISSASSAPSLLVSPSSIRWCIRSGNSALVTLPSLFLSKAMIRSMMSSTLIGGAFAVRFWSAFFWTGGCAMLAAARIS